MKRAFTLIEFVICIVVVGVLVLVTVPMYTGMMDKSHLSEAFMMVGQIHLGLKKYRADHNGDSPLADANNLRIVAKNPVGVGSSASGSLSVNTNENGDRV